MGKIKKISMALAIDNQEQVRLVIETAFGGGSLALFGGENLLDVFRSKSQKSKSEDLLSDISSLLEKNRVKKTRIGEIIYSKGEGSYTGLRIGRATSEGLCAALNCGCFGISVLEALTAKAKKNGLIQTTITDTKNQFKRKVFEKKGDVLRRLGEYSETIQIQNFYTELEKFEETILLNLAENFELENHPRMLILDKSENVARLMGDFRINLRKDEM